MWGFSDIRLLFIQQTLISSYLYKLFGSGLREKRLIYRVLYSKTLSIQPKKENEVEHKQLQCNTTKDKSQQIANIHSFEEIYTRQGK